MGSVVMDGVLVWLAVMAAAFHMAHAQCLGSDGNNYANDAVVTGGREEMDFRLGWISICIGGEWRQVCDDGWSRQGARVLCRQMGFSTGTAQHCGDSCFGCGRQHGGITLDCTGTEEGLSQCHQTDLGTICGPGRCAGVICIRERTGWTPPPTTAPTITTPTAPAVETLPTGDTCMCPIGEGGASIGTPISPPSIGAVMGEGAQQPCPSPAALGGVLGALTAILAILLVGVVIGWVWSCRRKPGLFGLQERSAPEPEQTFLNPSYTPMDSLACPQPVPSTPEIIPPGTYEDIPDDPATPPPTKDDPASTDDPATPITPSSIVVPVNSSIM